MERVTLLLFYLYLLVFPLGQLGRLPLNIPSVNLYLTDLLIILLNLVWWPYYLFHKHLTRSKTLVSFAIFMLIALISLLLNPLHLAVSQLLISFLYLLRFASYVGLLGYLKTSHIKISARVLVYLSVVIAFFGLVQYFLIPDLHYLQIFGWDPHYHRLVGTFLDPNYTGIIMVLGLLLLLKIKTKSKADYLFLLLLFIATMLTYSRSSYLAYLVGLVLLGLQKRAWKQTSIGIVIFILSFVLLPRQAGGEGLNLQRTSTINARLQNWQQAVRVISDHPLLGVGFDTLRYAKLSYHWLGADSQISHSAAGFDSSLLTVAAMTGLFGLGAFLWWLVVIIKSTKTKIYLHLPLLVHSFFVNSLFYPWILGWWLISLCTE